MTDLWQWRHCEEASDEAIRNERQKAYSMTSLVRSFHSGFIVLTRRYFFFLLIPLILFFFCYSVFYMMEALIINQLCDNILCSVRRGIGLVFVLRCCKVSGILALGVTKLNDSRQAPRIQLLRCLVHRSGHWFSGSDAALAIIAMRRSYWEYVLLGLAQKR